MKIKKYFETKSKIIDRALNGYLPAAKSKLITAMRYSLFAGGKRFRPILMLAIAQCFHKNDKTVLAAACAMEMIHTSTLIHDDLPAMDDSDLRRGKPTNHKVFGEDLAVLAGDALINEAYLLLARELPAAQSAQIAKLFADAIGTQGVIEGQVLDLEAEGKTLKLSELRKIHSLKTGALLEASVSSAAVLAKAKPAQLLALKRYSQALGLAFQIRDDILDAVGDQKQLGKSQTDQRNQKQTYVKILGVKGAELACEREIKIAKDALQQIGFERSALNDLIDFVGSRKN